MTETIETVSIPNENLKNVYDVFYNIPLNGKKSRHRTKFIKKLTEAFDEYQEDRKNLIDEFSKKDKNGNIQIDPENPNSILLNIEEHPNAKQEILDLDKEKASIIIKDKKVLLNIIDNMETQLSGDTAIIIDTLAEQLEEN